MPSVSLIGVDARTGSRVGGGKYFINGVASGEQAQLSPGKTYTFDSTASGYSPGRVQFLVRGDAPVTVTIPMMSQSRDVAVWVQCYPAESGITLTLDGIRVMSANTAEGGLVSFPEVTPGEYQLICSDPRFEPSATTITVGDQRRFQVSLIRKEGTGDTPVNSLATQEDSFPILTEDVSEAIYDRSGSEWFFTSTQARLYIGSLFIDQMASLQIALQQNNVPIFGYCSQFADAYGQGRSLIQGQLVINYVHSGYLYNALAEHANANTPASAVSTSARIAAAVKSGTATRVMDLLNTSLPEDVAAARSLIRRKASGTDYFRNPLYRHTVFDARLEIGDGAFRSYRLIEGMKLGANEMIVHAASGEALAESYGFTARRLR